MADPYSRELFILGRRTTLSGLQGCLLSCQCEAVNFTTARDSVRWATSRSHSRDHTLAVCGRSKCSLILAQPSALLDVQGKLRSKGNFQVCGVDAASCLEFSPCERGAQRLRVEFSLRTSRRTCPIQAERVQRERRIAQYTCKLNGNFQAAAWRLLERN